MGFLWIFREFLGSSGIMLDFCGFLRDFLWIFRDNFAMLMACIGHLRSNQSRHGNEAIKQLVKKMPNSRDFALRLRLRRNMFINLFNLNHRLLFINCVISHHHCCYYLTHKLRLSPPLIMIDCQNYPN